MMSHRVGQVDLAVAVHGRGVGSPRWMFPDVPASTLMPAIGPYLASDGNLDFVYSSVVVEFGGHVVLLDAGPAPADDSETPNIVLALRDAGLSPSDVDIVVISHGHDDHVGGLSSSENGITFPNARHYVSAHEFAHWSSEPRREHLGGRNLAVVAQVGALTRVEGEAEIVPGLTLHPAPGHTPGHLAVVIGAGRDRALYVGDVLAHRVNVAHPDWNHFSDMLPEQARRTRKRLVERAAADDMLVVASHIPVCGRIRGDQGERTLVPIGTAAGTNGVSWSRAPCSS